MTVKEGNQLIEQLKQEINEGIDVELNKDWIRCLRKSILKATEEGYNKALKQLQKS